MSKQIILDFFASGNNKDTDALSALLADDFTGTLLPSSLGVPTMNKEKFTAGAVKFTSDVPDAKYTIEEILEAGSAVVVHSKASGAGFSNEFIWIFHISGGKITSMKQFGDAQVLAAHLDKLKQL
ncbi:hypothetical protein C8J57DRAFT_1713413 [Mycena rebaudengoi]|nr:hypothetical protein C8J57DRAFT_1718487 [Mycena rebaudengoi]KAJ7277704.1 hypothetical protein C8J57DRAFT_1713413 [Mycena rebaudengoi]